MPKEGISLALLPGAALSPLVRMSDKPASVHLLEAFRDRGYPGLTQQFGHHSVDELLQACRDLAANDEHDEVLRQVCQHTVLMAGKQRLADAIAQVEDSGTRERLAKVLADNSIHVAKHRLGSAPAQSMATRSDNARKCSSRYSMLARCSGTARCYRSLDQRSDVTEVESTTSMVHCHWDQTVTVTGRFADTSSPQP